MVQQLNPVVRYGKGTSKTNAPCVTGGMDQGFHNWLLYTGELDKYMDVKIYQQVCMKLSVAVFTVLIS
jgi:hypothetical protein